MSKESLSGLTRRMLVELNLPPCAAAVAYQVEHFGRATSPA